MSNVFADAKLIIKAMKEKSGMPDTYIPACNRCGNLKVVWVDMWETNCPKCNLVKK